MLHSIIRDHDQNLAKKNEKIRALEKSTSIVAAKYAKGDLKNVWSQEA